MARVSLCMIVKNESDNLKKLLPLAKNFVGEIIVVDTGSTDNTKEVARSIGAKVADFVWTDDFSAARNFSIKNASGEWILVLDADEEIKKEDFGRLMDSIETPGVDAFRFEVVNHLPVGGKRSFRLVRLFRNNKKFRFESPVHETIEPSIKKSGGKIEDAKFPIHHYGLLNADLKKKAENYRRLVLEGLKKEPENIRLLFIAAESEQDLEKSLSHYLKVAAINPSYKNVWFRIGLIMLKKGDAKGAIDAYEKSLRHNPDSPNAPQAINNLAVLYARTEQKEKAVRILDEGIRKFPKNKALPVNLNAIRKR